MSKFQSLLAKLPAGLTKDADVESPDEVQMEMDFGRLAYTFLKDRAPGLLPHTLGFEVVEREEDGSKAIGIFGFKIGGDYYYVPAFFVNNQIKGMDLLYSKRTNLFMPLMESWVSYITDKQTMELGEGVSNPKPLQEDFEQPRFDFLVRPPTVPTGIPKTSELKGPLVGEVAKGPLVGESVEDMGEAGKDVAKATKPTDMTDSEKRSALDTIHDGFNVWNEMQEQMVAALEKDSEFQSAWTCAICRLTGEPLPIEKSADGSQLLDWIEKKGGVPAVNGLMGMLTRDPKFANAALTFYPDVESLFVTKFAEELKPETETTKITVVTKKTEYLDGKERSRLVRDGFTIHDTRPEASKSEDYEVDYLKRFGSPDNPGLYHLLLRNGATTKAWVFSPAGAAGSDKCLVVETADKNFFLAEPSAVFVRGEEVIEGPSAYDEAIKPANIEIGQRYVLINEKGQASMPLEVRSIVAEDGERIRMRVNWITHPSIERPTYGHDFGALHTRHDYATPCTCDAEYIQLADHVGNIGTTGNNTLVVPSNWKALELMDNESKMESYEATQVMEDLFRPGNLDDVFAALRKNAFHNLTVGSDDGMEYYIRFDKDFADGHQMNYKSAMVRLVGKYGLSVDSAETMLKEAQVQYKSRRLIKLGQMVGVSMPPPPAEATGFDEFTGVQTQGPQTSITDGTMTGVQLPQNSLQPGFNIGSETGQDLQTGELANQAAQTGQKQVFDHAAIGGLSKLYDSGAVIDGYVPELVQSLDRLGRILFLFYWKNEEFAERYGTKDLAEMEDQLRGVFKSFGDLVLQLRQKSIDAEDAASNVV